MVDDVCHSIDETLEDFIEDELEDDDDFEIVEESVMDGQYLLLEKAKSPV